MSNQTNQTLQWLVIPLLPCEEDLSVFEEFSDEPVSLRRKAQFFIDQKLYGRARHILELLVDLGSRDDALALTLASLQIAEGSFDLARDTLSWIKEPWLYSHEILRCSNAIARRQLVEQSHDPVDGKQSADN